VAISLLRQLQRQAECRRKVNNKKGTVPCQKLTTRVRRCGQVGSRTGDRERLLAGRGSRGHRLVDQPEEGVDCYLEVGLGGVFFLTVRQSVR
jgi:hypothetical protein